MSHDNGGKKSSEDAHDEAGFTDGPQLDRPGRPVRRADVQQIPIADRQGDRDDCRPADL
jgi:hypothetical protein